MKTVKLSVLAFLSAGLLASAASAADTAGYTQIVQIKTWTAANEPYHVYTEDVADGRRTCNGAVGNEFRLAKSEEDMFRMLLAAQLGGRTVQLQYTCNGTVGNITGVRMK